MSQNYICSVCRQVCYFDGRCGDGPILMCGCDKGEWVNDGRGGFYTNPSGAKPVQAGEPAWDKSWENYGNR